MEQSEVFYSWAAFVAALLAVAVVIALVYTYARKWDLLSPGWRVAVGCLCFATIASTGVILWAVSVDARSRGVVIALTPYDDFYRPTETVQLNRVLDEKNHQLPLPLLFRRSGYMTVSAYYENVLAAIGEPLADCGQRPAQLAVVSPYTYFYTALTGRLGTHLVLLGTKRRADDPRDYYSSTAVFLRSTCGSVPYDDWNGLADWIRKRQEANEVGWEGTVFVLGPDMSTSSYQMPLIRIAEKGLLDIPRICATRWFMRNELVTLLNESHEAKSGAAQRGRCVIAFMSDLDAVELQKSLSTELKPPSDSELGVVDLGIRIPNDPILANANCDLAGPIEAVRELSRAQQAVGRFTESGGSEFEPGHVKYLLEHRNFIHYIASGVVLPEPTSDSESALGYVPMHDRGIPWLASGLFLTGNLAKHPLVLVKHDPSIGAGPDHAGIDHSIVGWCIGATLEGVERDGVVRLHIPRLLQTCAESAQLLPGAGGSKPSAAESFGGWHIEDGSEIGVRSAWPICAAGEPTLDPIARRIERLGLNKWQPGVRP